MNELVEFTTTKKKLYRFTKMIEVVNDITILDFSDDAIRTLQVDPAHVSMIEMKLESSKLDDYQLNDYNTTIQIEDEAVECLEIGVNILDIKRFLRSFKMEHEIKVSITGDLEERKTITLTGTKGKITLTDKLKGIPIEEFTQPSNLDFDNDNKVEFEMKNSDFRETLKDCKTLDQDHIKLIYNRYDDKSLLLHTGIRDNENSKIVEYKDEDPTLIKDNSEGIIDSIIAIDHLYSISKAIRKNGNIWHMTLKNSYPLMMYIELDLGIEAEYLVAPKLEGA